MDRASKPPTSSSLADDNACLLPPPQHGGARSTGWRPRCRWGSRSICIKASPEYVPRTRTASARRSLWLITQSQVLERLFEHGLSYTSGPTVRQANVRRGTHKPSTTRRCAGRSARLVAQARYVLQASRIALRRTERAVSTSATAAFNSAMREQDTKRQPYDPAHDRQLREDCAGHRSVVWHW